MKSILLSLIALTASLHATAPSGKSQSLTSPDQVPKGLAKSDWHSIRAAYEAGRHAFHAVDGGWQARNPGQQWTTNFDGRGFLATPRGSGWTWGLELVSYGLGDQQQPVQGKPEVTANGQRLSYQWDSNLEEWFVNDQRGLEHGFIVKNRPQADSADSSATLEFLITTRGNLRPAITPDEKGVSFHYTQGNAVLNYTGLKVWDADGKILNARFESAGEKQVKLRVEEQGARYPITIDPIAQQAYLKAGNNGPLSDDQFGYSVSVSGDTVVVGAPYEDSSTTGVNSTPIENAVDSGAAYVFVRSGTAWSQQAYLKAFNTGSGDEFGYSVAVSGNTVVVGARSEDSSATGINSTPNENASTSGAAYIFVRSGTTWSQQAYLKASNTGSGDAFGYSVAISSDTVVVGGIGEDSSTTGINSTPNENASSSGAAYVFVRSGTTWSQQAYLKASNTGAQDSFGGSVAASGDTVVVGAYWEDSSTTGINSTPNESATDSGAAYVFVRSGTTWSQQAYLKASSSGAGDWFGRSVGISGDTVLIGAFLEDSSTTGVNSTPNESATDSGSAYVFVRNGTTWSQQAYLKASNNAPGDRFGFSVAVSGDTVVVGARQEDSSTTGVNSTPNESATDSGSAYVFVRNGTTWSQQAYLKASNTGSDDWFGYSVAISGETVVIGATREDSSTTGVNSTPDDIVRDAGAAYVFVRSGTTWSQQAYLKASNTSGGIGVNDYFGCSVAVSGDTVVVGAYMEDSGATGVNSTPNDNSLNSGAAYVFIRSGTTWSQQAYLKPSNDWYGELYFGYSVAVSGDTVVVGAFGEDSSTTGVNSTPNWNASNSGAAYVFVRSGTTWSQQAYLKASNTGAQDYFGYSVAVSGDTLVVGALLEDSSTTGVNSTPNESATDSGAAYVFVRTGTTWSQQAYLKASNSGSSDEFARSVAVSGETVVVGARSEDSSTTGMNSIPNENASTSGAAYVFVRSGTTWSQQAYLKASNTGLGDDFGYAVAVSGDTLVVGATGEDSSTTGINSTSNESASNSGAVYVFVRSGTTWSQQAYLKASNTGSGDAFGYAVAVSGETVVVGATGEDSSTTGINSTSNESALNSGAVYVFVRSGTTWSQQAYLKASNTGSGDAFGYSVAVSGETVVVGASGEDSSTTGVNSSPDEGATDSGAVYVFAGLGLPPTVASISPTSGTISGDTSVTITGANFTEVSAVTIGGAPVSSFTVNSPTSITATTPARATAGVVDVAVTSSTGTGTGAGLFTYQAPDIALEAPTGTAVNNGAGTLAFGSTNLNVAVDRTLTLRNTGPVGLTGIALTLGGTAASQFAIVSPPSSTLAGNGSVQFTLRFTPTTAGAKSATLSIASNDPDENPFTLALTGTGNGAPTNITLSASSVAENVAANTSVGTLSTSDPNSGNTFTYSLVSGTGSTDNASFNISGSSLRIGILPNFEVKNSYSVRIRSTDQGGLFFEKAFTIAITNVNEGPSIQVPASPLIAEATSASGAVVTYTITGSDPEQGTISGSGTPASGSVFPLGDTTVNATVTDSGSLSANGSFIVRVVDTTAPVIAPYADLTVVAPDFGGTLVDYPAATATDEVGLDSLTYSQASGTLFPLGQTTVTITATDAANNISTRTFTVNVIVVNDPPVFTLSTANVSVVAGSGPQVIPSFVSGILPGPADEASQTVNFLVSSSNPGLFTNPPAISSDGTLSFTPGADLGSAIITVTAQDNGGTLDGGVDTSLPQTFTLTLTNAVPVVAINASSGAGTGTPVAITVTAADPNTGDEAAGFAWTVDYGDSSPPVTFPAGTPSPLALSHTYATPGVFTVTATATDRNNGQSAQATTTITVEDQTLPTIQQMPDIGPIEATGPDGAVVIYQPALVTDNSGSVPGVVYSQASGTVFPLGITSVTATATDGSGNQVSTSFEVTVVDTTAPLAAAPAGGFSPTSLVAGPGGTASMPDFRAQLVASDAVGVTEIIQAPPAGSAAAPGAVAISLVARDASNNFSLPVNLNVTVETPGLRNGSFEINGGRDSNVIEGWTLANGGGLLAIDVQGSTDGQFSAGFNVGNTGNGGILSQTFATQPGTTYQVSFDFGAFSVPAGKTWNSQLMVRVRDGGLAGSGNDMIIPGSGRITGSTGGELVGNGSTIQVRDQSGTDAVDAAAPNSQFSVVSFRFTAQGPQSTLVFTDQSSAGVDSQDAMLDNVRVDAVAEDTFEAWAAGAGLAGADADPLATPFGDGVPNLVKYAFNMDGTRADISVLQPGGTSGLPSITTTTIGGQQLLRIEFIRRKDGSVIYVPEISTNLLGFAPMTSVPTVSPINSGWERAVVEQFMPPGTTAAFARVRINTP